MHVVLLGFGGVNSLRIRWRLRPCSRAFLTKTMLKLTKLHGLPADGLLGSWRELSSLEERTGPPTGPEGRYCSCRKTDLQRLLIPPSMAPVAQGDCVADALPSSAEHVRRVIRPPIPMRRPPVNLSGADLLEEIQNCFGVCFTENWII